MKFAKFSISNVHHAPKTGIHSEKAAHESECGANALRTGRLDVNLRCHGLRFPKGFGFRKSRACLSNRWWVEPIHPAILTIRDHGDHVRVLSYSSYPTIAGRPKVRSSIHRMAEISRASSWNLSLTFPGGLRV